MRAVPKSQQLLRAWLFDLQHQHRMFELGKAAVDQRGEGSDFVEHERFRRPEQRLHVALGGVGGIDVDAGLRIG